MVEKFMSPPTLRECPFCGGEATFGKAIVYMYHGWRVKCLRCGAGSVPYLVDTPVMSFKGALVESTIYGEEQAKQMTAKAWNRRAGESNENN